MFKKTEWYVNDRQKKPLKYLLYDAKRRAKEKDLEFSVKSEDIHWPACCPILGIELVPQMTGRKDSSPSLDRIDNDKGYVPGNVRVISLKTNRNKSDMTIEQVRRLLRYMEEVEVLEEDAGNSTGSITSTAAQVQGFSANSDGGC